MAASALVRDASFGADGVVIDNRTPNAKILAVAVQPDGRIVGVGRSARPDRPGAYRTSLWRFLPDGQPDPKFGTGGVAHATFGRFDEAARAVVLQRDGKIVVGAIVEIRGYGYDIAVARFRADGTLDPSFGTNGFEVLNFGSGNNESAYVGGLALDAADNIIVTGQAKVGGRVRSVVTRRMKHGNKDIGFMAPAGQGELSYGNGDAFGIAAWVKRDGRIVIVGGSGGNDPRFAMSRLLPDGTPDKEFAQGGNSTILAGSPGAAYAVVEDPQGRLVAAGWRFADKRRVTAVLRCTADGRPDPDFGPDGVRTLALGESDSSALGLAMTPEARVLVGSAAKRAGRGVFALAALEPAVVDSNQTAVECKVGDDDEPAGMTLQLDGRVILAGSSRIGDKWVASLVRFKPVAGDGVIVTRPAGPASEAQIGAAGGTIEFAGARVAFPAGTLSSARPVRLTTIPAPKTRDPLFKPLGPNFVLTAGQWAFKPPLRVELPYDPAKLPPGMTAQDIVPLIAVGAIHRPLPGGKVDAERKVLTFELSSLATRFCSEGEGAAGQAVSLTPGAEWEPLKFVAEDANVELRAIPDYTDKKKAKWELISKTIAAAKAEYTALGFHPPEKVQIGITRYKREESNRGETTTSTRTYYNCDVIDGPDDELVSTLWHEYFHNIQYGSATMVSGQFFPGRWMDESSASWFQYKKFPNVPLVKARIADLGPADFGDHFFWHTLGRHEYTCFLFWVFMERDYDVPKIFQKLYPFVPAGQPEPKSYETIPPFLDTVLRQTPDRSGRVRGLNEILPDFIAHFMILKDMEPLTSLLKDPHYSKVGAIKDLAAPGKPPVYLYTSIKPMEAADIPSLVAGPDGSRKRKFTKLKSKLGGISAVYLINRPTLPSDGTLRVGVIAPQGAAGLVVIPQVGTQYGAPLTGPEVKLPDWQKWEKVTVLLVDCGLKEDQDLQVEVELMQSGSFMGTWTGTCRSPLGTGDYRQMIKSVRRDAIPDDATTIEDKVDIGIVGSASGEPTIDKLGGSTCRTTRVTANSIEFEVLDDAGNPTQRGEFQLIDANHITGKLFRLPPVKRGRLTFKPLEGSPPLEVPAEYDLRRR